MSQLFSNVYLNSFDNYVKRELKIKHYGRYVDDAFILHKDKEYLKSLIPVISRYLKEELGLSLNMKKVHIFDLFQNFKFLGACIKPHRRYVSNRTVKSFHRKVNKIEQMIKKGYTSKDNLLSYRDSLNSYLGYLSKFKCREMIERTFESSIINEYFHFSSKYKKVTIFKDKI